MNMRTVLRTFFWEHFGTKCFYSHIVALNIHYFLLANQSVWLSGQMRFSYTDKRNSLIFIWWENIHVDTPLYTPPHNEIAQTRSRRLKAWGANWVKVQAGPRAALSAAVTDEMFHCIYHSMAVHSQRWRMMQCISMFNTKLIVLKGVISLDSFMVVSLSKLGKFLYLFTWSISKVTCIYFTTTFCTTEHFQ